MHTVLCTVISNREIFFSRTHLIFPLSMVADFGMAKDFDTAGLSRITKSGTIMGTPVLCPSAGNYFKYSKPEVDVWCGSGNLLQYADGEFPKNFRPGKKHGILSYRSLRADSAAGCNFPENWRR
jgi:hypothetical protein